MAESPNLELLRTFVSAEAAPTLSVAAATRRVTKSAVSQQLKTLEGQLGVVLFEKVGRNVRPTDAAKALATSLREAFAVIDDSVDAARERQGAVRGVVRIGAPRPFAAFWLRPRLASLLGAQPELVIEVTFGNPSELERRLVAGDLDLALLVRSPDAAPLETVPLFVEAFDAVAAPAYVKAHGTPRTADDFAGHRFVVFDADLPMHAAWWRATFGAKSPLRGTVACRVASLDEMRALAVDAAAIAVLPDYFVEEELRARALVSLTPRSRKSVARNPIVLAWRRGVAETARLRAVRTALSSSSSSSSSAR